MSLAPLYPQGLYIADLDSSPLQKLREPHASFFLVTSLVADIHLLKTSTALSHFPPWSLQQAGLFLEPVLFDLLDSRSILFSGGEKEFQAFQGATISCATVLLLFAYTKLKAWPPGKGREPCPKQPLCQWHCRVQGQTAAAE